MANVLLKVKDLQVGYGGIQAVKGVSLEVREGELIGFLSAGAYGYTMASRYNTRGMAAEVLVKGSAFELIHARETFEQMIAGEKIPAFLK